MLLTKKIMFAPNQFKILGLVLIVYTLFLNFALASHVRGSNDFKCKAEELLQSSSIESTTLVFERVDEKQLVNLLNFLQSLASSYQNSIILPHFDHLIWNPAEKLCIMVFLTSEKKFQELIETLQDHQIDFRTKFQDNEIVTRLKSTPAISDEKISKILGQVFGTTYTKVLSEQSRVIEYGLHPRFMPILPFHLNEFTLIWRIDPTPIEPFTPR